jgi:hypothetical protein
VLAPHEQKPACPIGVVPSWRAFGRFRARFGLDGAERLSGAAELRFARTGPMILVARTDSTSIDSNELRFVPGRKPLNRAGQGATLSVLPAQGAPDGPLPSLEARSLVSPIQAARSLVSLIQVGGR